MARSRRGLGLALALAALVVAADQVSKWVVRREEAALPLRLGRGLRIELHRNPGISFSQLSDSGDLVLALVSVGCAGVAVATWLAPSRYRPALGLVLGGALGNLADRLLWDGAVLDFIGVYTWPAFNVADAAIVAGTALLVLQVLRGASN